MTKYLIQIGIIGTLFLAFILMKNIDNKKTKYVILIGPFILGGLIYFSIMLLTRNTPPDACDGAGLLGILISFLLFGMGILFNIINIFRLFIIHKAR